MDSATLLMPEARQRASVVDRGTSSLSPELLAQSVGRLRVLVLLYAFIFFMAGFFVALLFADDRARLFHEPVNWVPGVVSIAVALLVWAFTLSRRVPLSIVMTVGLCFEVVSSYGIAFAEYLDPQRLNDNGWMGLSWVAVWTLLFTRGDSHPSAQGAAGGTRIGELGSCRHRLHGRNTPDDVQSGACPVLLLDRLSVFADDDHGVRGCARRLYAGQGGHRSA